MTLIQHVTQKTLFLKFGMEFLGAGSSILSLGNPKMNETAFQE